MALITYIWLIGNKNSKKVKLHQWVVFEKQNKTIKMFKSVNLIFQQILLFLNMHEGGGRRFWNWLKLPELRGT